MRVKVEVELWRHPFREVAYWVQTWKWQLEMYPLRDPVSKVSVFKLLKSPISLELLRVRPFSSLCGQGLSVLQGSSGGYKGAYFSYFWGKLSSSDHRTTVCGSHCGIEAKVL